MVRNRTRRKYLRRQRRTRRRRARRQRGGTEPPKRPPASINDHIHHIIYINLDSRTDRREEVEKELDIFPNEKKTRLSAVKDEENPPVGCIRSHLKAITSAKEKNYPNVLITEDDFVWANVTDGYADFEKLIKMPYDVIMLGGTHAKLDPETRRVKWAQSGHAYLVHNRYYDTIINKLQGAIRDFDSVPSKEKVDKIHVDLQYTQLQPLHQWFLVQPALAIQRPSYSNLVKANVNYAEYFNK